MKVKVRVLSGDLAMASVRAGRRDGERKTRRRTSYFVVQDDLPQASILPSNPN